VNPLAAVSMPPVHAAGVVFAVRLTKAGVDSWLVKTSSGRWELTTEAGKASVYTDAAKAKKVYANMPRVALAALESGSTIELVRMEYSVEVKVRVIKPEPKHQEKGRCDCCGKKLRVFRLRIYDLCGSCYESSHDTHGLPCKAVKATKEEKVTA
jgi:hypothetical protein